MEDGRPVRQSKLTNSVAQDDNRRPRGYGTALFASEQDAARAVQMFNG